MPKILHISDLHFGKNAFHYIALLKTPWKNTYHHCIEGPLYKFFSRPENKPDLLVVTGDIVTSLDFTSSRLDGTRLKRAYADAAEFLLRLSDIVGLDRRKHIIIVPGNHDLPRMRMLYRDRIRRTEHFRWFYTHVVQDDPQLLDERIVYYLPEHKICLYSFDSTLKGQGKPVKGQRFVEGIAEGMVGSTFFNLVESRHNSRFPRSATDGIYRVALIHHHPHACPKTTNKSLLNLIDEEAFQSFVVRLNINMVLHGHKHVPYFKLVHWHEDGGELPRRIHVIGGGTLSHIDPNEQGRWGNNFNLIDIEHGRYVQYRRYKYTKGEFRCDDTDDGKHTDYYRRKPYNLGIAHGAESMGYSIDEVETIVRIRNFEGDAVIHKKFHGIRMMEGVERDRVSVLVEVNTQPGRIESGNIIDPVDPRIDVERSGFRGRLELTTGRALYDVYFKEPVRYEEERVNVYCDFSVEKMFCMSIGRMKEYYGSSLEQEYFIVPLREIGPAIRVKLDVMFPPDYPLPSNWAIIVKDDREYNLKNGPGDWKIYPDQWADFSEDMARRVLKLLVQPCDVRQKYKVCWIPWNGVHR